MGPRSLRLWGEKLRRMTDDELAKFRRNTVVTCSWFDGLLKEADQEGDRRRGNAYAPGSRKDDVK
jgi:hypothetical protein